MKKYKVGFIGCGRSAWDLHANLLETHPRFQITAAYDINYDSMKRFSQAFGAKVCETLEDFFNSGVDIAIVLTISSTHAALACECLKHGINALVSKPWAASLQEADEMIRTAKENGVHVYEFLAQQWETDLCQLKEIVNSGTIGKIFQIRRSAFTFGKRSDWQTQKKYAGGYLNNWGPHLIGQAIDLVGDHVVSVCADSKQIINDGDAEDMFYAMLRTKSGILLNVEYNIMTDYMPSWIVQGDQGTIYVKDQVIEVHRVFQPDTVIESIYRNEVRVEIDKIPYDSVDRKIIYSDLAMALDGTHSFRVSVDFSRHLTEVISAIRRSSETRETVKIP